MTWSQCRRMLVAAVISTTAFLAVAASWSGAATTGSANYVIAEIRFSESGGVGELLTQIDQEIEACLDPDLALGYLCKFAPDGGPLQFTIQPGDAGTTLWEDPSTARLESFVRIITNGRANLISQDILSWASVRWADEAQFFGSQAGPSGTDLQGYEISRVGVRIDDIVLQSPGSDPNGDGIWTDYALRGAFTFEGHIADKAACKTGDGWKRLVGPGGAHFATQGDCIQSVLSGR